MALLQFFATGLLAFQPSLAADGPPAQLAEARALLDGGQAKEALEKAKEGLEFAPDLPEMLDLASRAAQAAGAGDEALWYAWIAAGELGSIAAPTKDQKALADGIQKRLGDLDPTGQKGSAAVSGYAAGLFAIGKDCAARKLYVNAVDLLQRCRGTPSAAAAEVELAKIFDNKKAVEALIESGLDVPVQKPRKKAPDAIAREDAKHDKWETAWEVKGDQYTVKTDMGREMAESFSLAMEQMNRFYRRVFHVKEFGGGKTARLTIRVYKSRAEFDEWEPKDDVDPKPIPKEVKGHIKYAKGIVATYDPREEQRPLSFLWSTLFHESSHQFTAMISADLIPSWLNEGTASYFEGARLQGNGVVETNLVAEERLQELEYRLQKGEPTLEQVITYFLPGSYPGEYYPFGWGLVYFLLNYEDEHSQRVYVQPYQNFIASYKSGGKHDVKGRFVEYFVTKAKQPGVSTFADFEERWKDWIHALHGLYYGGPEVADQLIARARKEVQDKAFESAGESYAWALRKRPGDPVASFELAELLALEKENDAAIYRFRGAVAALRLLPDAAANLPGSPERTGRDLLELSEARLAKLDKGFADAKSKADEAFAAAAADAARGYAEKSLPLCSLRLLDQARTLYGGASALADLRAEIAQKSGADTRRWRRLKIAGDLAEWESYGEWKAVEGALAGTADPKHGPTYCYWRDDPPERFRFEARIDASDLDKEEGLCGLLFGVNEEGLHFLGARKDGALVIGSLKKEPEISKPISYLKPSQIGSFTLAIEVFPDHVEFSVDGKAVGKPLNLDPDELRGQIGIVLQGGRVTLREVRVRS